MYETVYGQPLLVNPILFILAKLLAVGAFKYYSTLEEIFAIEPPPGEDYWILEWADYIQDVPLFQTMTHNGPTGKIQTASAFSYQLTSASVRAGFKNITIHDARREALIKADGKFLTFLGF